MHSAFKTTAWAALAALSNGIDDSGAKQHFEWALAKEPHIYSDHVQKGSMFEEMVWEDDRPVKLAVG